MFKFLSLYFGFIPTQSGDRSNRLEYGFTAWQRAETDQGGGGTKPAVRFDLVGTKCGLVSVNEVGALIAGFSAENVAEDDEGELITDDLDYVAQFIKLSNGESDRTFSQTTVIREASSTAQILKFGAMLNRDRFFVPENLLVTHDLIFPESSLNNLIDQQTSDEQKSYPRTQSLLIACHGLEHRGREISFISVPSRNPMPPGYDWGVSRSRY